ncbi:hypothetical protein WJ15_00030 [Burkholderia cepacia]|uniref:hypothetical protein n=1 Tax=Burkholderia contaminans TaxID=488447 RepID=UPI00076BF9AC|nr:hypothetical protein [Burkholderia contaminans]KVF66295.1 hypothetical protein WJ15_00030 [Burkholderia cepacia]UUX37256.1 hypothetical protein NTJ56_00020 [Burkholderia contaminans]
MIDRGIPDASLAGSIACVEPVFRPVLPYGEYAVLLPDDIKKTKIEKLVKPGGCICLELVLRHAIGC